MNKTVNIPIKFNQNIFEKITKEIKNQRDKIKNLETIGIKFKD